MSSFNTERFPWGWWLLLASLAAVYTLAVGRLSGLPHPLPEDGLRIVVPRWVQVLMMGGDRYLAANVGVFRALFVGGGELSEGSYPVLARVQADAALLNPGSEDNYYLATAILPWQGEVAATQLVLREATAARPSDVYPPFFYAFNTWHFQRDIGEALRYLRLAAEREADQGNRVALLAMVAAWSEPSKERQTAIAILNAMAQQSRHPQVKEYLLQRASRLRALEALDEAVTRFRAQERRAPQALDELVRAGVLGRLPQDPMGKGFMLDASGQVVVATKRAKQRKIGHDQ